MLEINIIYCYITKKFKFKSWD